LYEIFVTFFWKPESDVNQNLGEYILMRTYAQTMLLWGQLP